MKSVVDMLAERLSILTDECVKEVLIKFPMLAEKRETVVDWTTNRPWGGTVHQITVEAMASCAVSNFFLDGTGKPTAMKGMPEKFPCRLMASFERGTVSISAHGIGVMMTVRMEDILKVIEEACHP